MTDTDTDECDRLGERLANIEGTVGQMNKRIDDLRDDIQDMREEIRSLRGEMQGFRSDVRNWIVFAVVAITSILTAVIAVVGFLM